ncbi:hypothetical protein LshimejAT787_0305160 [Lyophyllum shimeji]|uniref:Uncharacterized protein n=1 Tax=Lyophyllum shimeji TaxID=47721 RepID=A0A9P3PIT8_LYOSH|nr:hypothetical protein LshimejAT787_0305160 [Lyophyllum shimeji]
MPTSTLPFEVLLEFTNDTSSAATVQLMRGESDASGGPSILLQRGENVSLVLSAGSTYHYRLRQSGRQARISVKTWQDTQCSVAKVLGGHYTREEAWIPQVQCVTVTCLDGDT